MAILGARGKGRPWEENHGLTVLRMTCTPVAWKTQTHRTEERGNQVLEALAACCLPQLLVLITQQITNKLRIKSSQ
ncbi:hypothetical protein DPMN_115001 [Dreissena polymorpha]|uniref:Uncharacterized protein n=1 Tax=Dreissena polymorpha TaxID=45954 RepID=A0A9D4KKF1_DREPO|nr:hypothetical protein DPMN_115001 [Dreissena polymorpha]